MTDYSLEAIMVGLKGGYTGGLKQARLVAEMMQESATLMHHDTITGTSPSRVI